MIVINVTQDGDQVCALIGEMPTEKAVGFGKTIPDALRDLADNIYNLTL